MDIDFDWLIDYPATLYNIYVHMLGCFLLLYLLNHVAVLNGVEMW